MSSPTNKGGRPRVPDAERRRHKLEVPVNDEEVGIVHRLSAKHQEPMAKIVRMALRKMERDGGRLPSE